MPNGDNLYNTTYISCVNEEMAADREHSESKMCRAKAT